MEYTYKKLADVEALTEVPEEATVFAEVNGEVKRIPGKGLGGSEIKTAIIKSSMYDTTLAALVNGGAMEAEADSITYSCLNMTFEEAYQTMEAGEPMGAFGMFGGEGCVGVYGAAMFAGTAMTGAPLLGFEFVIMGNTTMLYWTEDGLSTEMPGGKEPQ